MSDKNVHRDVEWDPSPWFTSINNIAERSYHFTVFKSYFNIRISEMRYSFPIHLLKEDIHSSRTVYLWVFQYPAAGNDSHTKFIFSCKFDGINQWTVKVGTWNFYGDE